MTKGPASGDQAHLSAQQARPEAPARLPRPHVDGRRRQGPLAPPRQGPQEALRLSLNGPANVVRLTKRAQFLYVQKGLKTSRPSVTVEARRRPEAAPHVGAGFTATKRLGGAVIRNRARRRLREAVRQLLPALGEPGVDYVFVARPAALSAPWPGLLDDVQNALLRLRADLRA